jgi:hypothetical protein
MQVYYPDFIVCLNISMVQIQTTLGTIFGPRLRPRNVTKVGVPASRVAAMHIAARSAQGHPMLVVFSFFGRSLKGPLQHFLGHLHPHITRNDIRGRMP